MKTTKHEGRRLSNGAAVAVLVLLSGVGANSRHIDAAPNAGPTPGRYRLTFDATVKGKKLTSNSPFNDIELKPKGQWRAVDFPEKGTYTIRNNEITFKWLQDRRLQDRRMQGRRMVESKARLTKNGFTKPPGLFTDTTFGTPVRNLRYIKLR